MMCLQGQDAHDLQDAHELQATGNLLQQFYVRMRHVALPVLEARGSSITPVWKGWHKARTSLTHVLQILSRGWEIPRPQATPLLLAKLCQLASGHSSSGRKALSASPH